MEVDYKDGSGLQFIKFRDRPSRNENCHSCGILTFLKRLNLQLMQPFKSTTHHAKIGWIACAQNLCVEIHLMHGKFASFPGSDVAQRNRDRGASWDGWKAASVNPPPNSTQTAIE